MADIKRMRYFDQQLLVLKDFTDEQDYHREMRRRHNQALHTTGVATGLDVTKTGTKEVTVKAGMAIDKGGQEIVLDADTKIDLSNATLFPPNSSALVTISFDTTLTDPYASDTTQNTRIKETFRLAATRETTGTPPDPTAVQLARLVLDAQGNVTLDLSVRRLAGTSAFDNPDTALTVRSLRLSNPSLPITQWPTLTATGANQMTLSNGLVVGSLGVIGDISVNGSVKTGADLSGRNLSLSGNLGVGTPSPEDKLHVSGGNMRLDNNRGFLIEDSAGAARRALLADPANTLHVGSGGAGGFDRIDFDLSTAGTTMTLKGGRVSIGTPSADAPFHVKQAVSALGMKVTANRTEGDNYKQPIAEFRHDNETQGVGIGYASVYATGSNANQTLFVSARGSGGLVLNGEDGGNVGIGTMAPTRPLDVKSNNGIKLGLEGSGGGQLILANNPNDNRVWLEAFNSTGNGNATEFLLTGFNGGAVPQISLVASTTVAFGSLRVNGQLFAAGGKVGYVVDQFINKLGETLEEGDVVVIGQNQSPLFYGQHNNIPIPEVDLAESLYQTGVCGIVCETHGELRPQTEGDDENQPRGGRKSKKPVTAPQAFTPEEMENKERTQVEPGQIGLMVTMGAFAHCKVDADIAAIKVGDLLTTSPTKGHAQKVLDPAQAVGAIVGKALGSLKKGKGKIPVMVTLQ